MTPDPLTYREIDRYVAGIQSVVAMDDDEELSREDLLALLRKAAAYSTGLRETLHPYVKGEASE